jgi:HSP20 family protein
MLIMPITHRQARNGHTAQLSRAFDRLFDDSVERAFAAPTAAISRLPAIDVRETEPAYTVQVDLPGVAKEDVKVTIEGKRVSIEATARTEAATEGERLLVRERSATAFARSLSLPVEIDEAASQARLDNGVLHLTLAKKLKPAAQLTVA